jgi:uncharacterized membrane protein
LIHQQLRILEEVVAAFGTRVRLPTPVVMAMALPLLIATIHERPSTPGAPMFILALLASAGGQVLAITISQYLLWTPTGGTRVEGLLGRYFLQTLPLVAIAASLAIGRIRPRRAERWIGWCVLGSALSLAIALPLMVLRE